MAASVSSYFILAPPTSNKPSNDDDERDDNPKSDTNERKDKGNTNKQIVLTRNELTRKRMDLIRAKLEESRAKYFEKIKNQALNCSRPIQKVSDAFTSITRDDNDNTKELVPISSNGELPYVYFVVAPEKQIKTSNVKFRSKQRSIVEDKRKQLVTRSTVSFTSREDYGLPSNKTRLMSLSRNFGIQPEIREIRGDSDKSIRHIVFPLPIKMPPKNPPTTPATTILTNSAGHYGSTEFDQSEFNAIIEKPVKMTICEDNEIIETREAIGREVVQRQNSTKSVSTRCLELPFISMDEQRKALGTSGSYKHKSLDFVRKSISQDSTQKRVHFADSVDLPSIRGSTIGMSSESLIPIPHIGRAQTVPDSSSEKSKSISDLYHTQSLPDERLLHTSDGKSKKYTKYLDLPKIDIVSTVYDELIMKAIQSYIMTLPPYSKQYQIAKHLLEQLLNKTMTTADLDVEQFRAIREDIASMPRSVHSKRKSQKPMRKGSHEKSYSPVEPKCYRMVLPGALPQGPKNKVVQPQGS